MQIILHKSEIYQNMQLNKQLIIELPGSDSWRSEVSDHHLEKQKRCILHKFRSLHLHYILYSSIVIRHLPQSRCVVACAFFVSDSDASSYPPDPDPAYLLMLRSMQHSKKCNCNCNCNL
jgi:hypothetical protein